MPFFVGTTPSFERLPIFSAGEPLLSYAGAALDLDETDLAARATEQAIQKRLKSIAGESALPLEGPAVMASSSADSRAPVAQPHSSAALEVVRAQKRSWSGG